MADQGKDGHASGSWAKGTVFSSTGLDHDTKRRLAASISAAGGR